MKKQQKQINKDLEGEQQDCPKGDKTKVQIDSPNTEDKEDEENVEKNDEETISENEIKLINKTLELCKYLFPYLAIISKSYKIFDFKEILISEKTKGLVISFLKYKKIELINYTIIVNIMNNIIDNNAEIVNNIREIYSIAPANKLRELIEKHFIPTNDEKRQSGEVSTPIKLVDDMLTLMPLEFWKKPQKVFEPCCGKGNFVLGIFDRFYKGLEEMYPDEIERCRVIMVECIYYADIIPLNVFITKEIMKCHVQSYCGLDELDFEFNDCTENTLELDIKKKWDIEGFDAVIGNPPYNSSGDTGTGNTIWQNFTNISLNKFLKKNGYLLYVHPPGWRKPNTERGKFYGLYKLMTQENQMIYLSIHGIKDGQKTFNCGTRYDWYIIQHTPKYTTTIVNDEKNNNIVIDMNNFDWLPNYNIDTIQSILAKKNEEKCNIIQSMSSYEPRKKWMSKVKTNEFKYPCIHSTPKTGPIYKYSKINSKGHFGVPKVIFGDSGINEPVIDIKGSYGMTQHAMGIEILNESEAIQLSKALKSEKMKILIDSCLFSSYAIDWNIFKDFKKYFWKEFI